MPFHQPSRGGPHYGLEADVPGELHRFLFRLRVELGESRLKLQEEPPCRIAAAKLGKKPHPPPVELFGVRVDLDGLLQTARAWSSLPSQVWSSESGARASRTWRHKDSAASIACF
jgi:hypothetical protein